MACQGQQTAGHDLGRRRPRRRDHDLRADHGGLLERGEARKPLSVGLNCSLGPDLMYPFLAELSQKANVAISCYPNAGLPNPLSRDRLRSRAGRHGALTSANFARGGLINIAGGCCGNTPEHIAAIAKALEGKAAAPNCRSDRSAGRARGDSDLKPLRLSGSQPFTQQPGVFIMIGERTNVAGSPKFAKLIKEGKYEEAVSVARQQVENGANVIDICMDEGMIDGVAAMTRYLQLLGSEPEVAKVPFMVDSSKWEVIEAGLKCLQGKGIVNSISLKEGEDEIPPATPPPCSSMARRWWSWPSTSKARPPPTRDRIRICERAYEILVNEVGFPPEDIIFDPNILTVGHGHRGAQQLRARLHRATRWIKENLPHAKV